MADRHPLFPNVRKSPYFARTEAAGAVAYMAYNHMYMPMDYGRGEDDYRSLCERVTQWDVGAERQVELAGPDALLLADRLVARDLSSLAPGACRYGVVCDDQGLVICDPVVLRVDAGRIWLSHGNVDLLLWAKGIAAGSGLDVAVREADVAPLQVQGPRSRDVLRPLVGTALDALPWYRLLHATIAGVPCVVSRTGWSGELGYEVMPLGSAAALAVWDAVAAAGQQHGIVVTAPNVPRALEHGITDTAWFHNQDANALELGERLVDLDAGDFVGREALRAIVASGGPRRRQVGLVTAATERLAPVEEPWPLLAAGRAVGGTRWVARSPALGRVIAIGLVEREHAAIGSALRLVHPGGEVDATVAALPFVQRPLAARA